MYTTLINAAELNSALHEPDTRVVDCRFDLADKTAGRKAYLAAHIPGAVYADIEVDLSGPPVTDHGRHPLPAPERLHDVFARLGINSNTQVVVYDQVAGSFAGRLWWLLRYMGHDAVAVLDGGWQKWLQAGNAVSSGVEHCPGGTFKGKPHAEWLVTADRVPQAELLIDSRDPARYRGEMEPLDPRAGHIPGAINRFWRGNLDDNGLFKQPSILRQEFERILGGTDPGDAVFYCGSGVTACHNILALVHGGLTMPKLYAGSWSDWCSSPDRPVAVGDN
jgi:thiosulfate/3-mercaptopyruvate sulfurtransferase